MHNTIRALLLASTTAVSSQVLAVPTVITDSYVGSKDWGFGDVIGDTSQFDIFSMEVELINTSLHVTINTNFAGRGDDGLYDWITYGEGIGYGDLFLSSSWNPYGSAPYYGDNHSTGTLWTYGFALDDRWGNGSSGTLYELNGSTNDDNAHLSDDFLSEPTFRNGQEVAVDTGLQTSVGTGSWTIDYGTLSTYDDNSLRFIIDLAGTNLLAGDYIALHWGMTCGNDVIEGVYEVPEPGILALLGMGLAGISFTRRKRA